MTQTTPQARRDLQVFPVDRLPADGILAIFPHGVKLLVVRSDLQPEVIETIRAAASKTGQDDIENEQGDRVRGKVWFSGCQTAFDIGMTGASLETLPITSEDAYESVRQFLRTFAIEYGSICSSVQVENPLPNHYLHTSVPDHAPRLVDEGKFKAKEGAQLADCLITLKEAADLYPDELTYDDVRRWHYSGLLEEQGRRWLTRPGGRSIPLVSQFEVAYLKDNRPPRGPIESFKRKKRGQIDRLRRSRSQTEIVPDEKLAEKKLITLKEAVETHGVAYETLRSWYRSGYLPERGREVFPTHGGGKILVDEKDVTRLINNPPARGRPQIKRKE